MALAFFKAGKLKPEIRLAQACDEFRKVLNASQSTTFRGQLKDAPPSYFDVASLANEIDKQISFKFRRQLGPRVEGFLNNIQVFVSIGDEIIGAAGSLPATAVWGVVRLSFQVRQVGKWFGLAWEVLKKSIALKREPDKWLSEAASTLCSIKRSLTFLWGRFSFPRGGLPSNLSRIS